MFSFVSYTVSYIRWWLALTATTTCVCLPEIVILQTLSNLCPKIVMSTIIGPLHGVTNYRAKLLSMEPIYWLYIYIYIYTYDYSTKVHAYYIYYISNVVWLLSRFGLLFLPEIVLSLLLLFVSLFVCISFSLKTSSSLLLLWSLPLSCSLSEYDFSSLLFFLVPLLLEQSPSRFFSFDSSCSKISFHFPCVSFSFDIHMSYKR